MASPQESTQTLPVELCVLIIEHLANDRGLQIQRDLASLRLSSRLLHRVATPHFYKVIELSSHSQVKELVAQLQAQPKLCNSTRFIWWNEEPLLHDGAYVGLEPYLVDFRRAEEVALASYRETYDGTVYPFGMHYALRDVGSWCHSVTFERPFNTLVRVLHSISWGDIDAHPDQGDMETHRISYDFETRSQEKEPDESAAYPEPSRSIWAMHLVLPGLRMSERNLYFAPRTITHLTVTLYEHVAIVDEPNAGTVLDVMLDAGKMPLLQHLHIQCVYFGKRQPPRTQEDDPFSGYDVLKENWRDETDGEDIEDDLDAIALEDCQQWLLRLAEVEYAVQECHDSRVTFEAIEFSGPREESLIADVRTFTLQQWQERVYHRRDGPWKTPMTPIVSSDSSGGLATVEDEERNENGEEDGVVDDE